MKGTLSDDIMVITTTAEEEVSQEQCESRVTYRGKWCALIEPLSECDRFIKSICILMANERKSSHMGCHVAAVQVSLQIIHAY